MKRFLKLFCKIRSRNQNCFSGITKGNITVTPRPLFLSISNASSISRFMINAKYEKFPDIIQQDKK